MKRVILIHSVLGGDRQRPIHLISAPGLGFEALNHLQEQVRQALLAPESQPIVTNYDVTWQVIHEVRYDFIYDLSLNDNEFTMLSSCHRQTGRSGGDNLASTWLPGFLRGRVPVGDPNDLIPYRLPAESVLILTTFDNSLKTS